MRRSLNSLLLPTVLLASATVACDAKSPPADAAAVPVVDSVVAVPPATPAADSQGVSSPTGATNTSTTTKTSAGKAPPSPYLGRDSAFGPTFTVDSTGKVTPIDPTKKKP